MTKCRNNGHLVLLCSNALLFAFVLLSNLEIASSSRYHTDICFQTNVLGAGSQAACLLRGLSLSPPQTACMPPQTHFQLGVLSRKLPKSLCVLCPHGQGSGQAGPEESAAAAEGPAGPGDAQIPRQSAQTTGSYLESLAAQSRTKLPSEATETGEVVPMTMESATGTTTTDRDDRAAARAKKREERRMNVETPKSESILAAVVNSTKSLKSATGTLRRNVQQMLVGHRLETSFLVSAVEKSKQSAREPGQGSALEDILLEDERAMEGVVGSRTITRTPGESEAYLQSLESTKTLLRTPTFLTRYPEDYWTRNLLTIWRSRVTKRIAPALLVNLLVAVSVALAFHFFPQVVPGLNGFVHTITGSFLALLITFRTDVGYKRFWEARKIWGTVHKRCRSMARVLGATSSARHRELVMQSLRLIKAFPYALKQHLRSQRNLEEMEPFLDESEVKEMRKSDNMPLFVCMRMSFTLRPLILDNNSTADTKVWEQADFHVEELVRCVGNSEMIANTPVPLSYSRHTSRFLFLWTITLPLFLVNACGPWASIPAHLFISWALLGTEQVGHLIEDPFGYIRPRFQQEQPSSPKKECMRED